MHGSRSAALRPAPPDGFGIREVVAIGFFAVAPFAAAFERVVGGLLIDPGDLFLLPGIAGVWILRRSTSTSAALPLRVAFFSYLTWTAAAYANSVYGLGYLSDPVRAGYQFYRYAWKPALGFPLAYFLLHGQQTRARTLALILTLIVVSDLNALAGIWQGRHGIRPTGLFAAIGHGNAFAASMLVSALIALGVAASVPRMAWRAFGYGSFTAMVMALWYAGSRGGAVGFLVGLAAYFAVGRARLKMIATTAIALVSLFAVHPDFGKHSGIRARFLEIADGTEAGTLEWRLTERWPYFLDKALDNPWLGVGSEADLSLGTEANTPHNGYLALAVRSGLPSLGLFLYFLLFALVRSAVVASRGASALERGVGAGVFATIVGVATHNVVDFIVGSPPTAYLFWMCCGLVTAMPVDRAGESREARAVRGRPEADADARRRGSARLARTIIVTG